MRSPFDKPFGLRSPFGPQSGGNSIPANAIQQRDGSYVRDRQENYIETRV